MLFSAGVNAAKTMQHASLLALLALLALPSARAVACECDEWRNGATAEDPALCRKGEGGKWMCTPPNMDGSCPGDHVACTQGEDPSPSPSPPSGWGYECVDGVAADSGNHLARRDHGDGCRLRKRECQAGGADAD